MTRTVPVTSTQAPGNFITGALWNAGVKALGDFLLAVPLFSGYQASAQSISSGAWTAIGIDTETLDSDGSHSNVTNNTRFTCLVPGVHVFLGMVAFASNSTGVRGSRFALNGTSVRGSQTNVNTNTGSVWSSPCFTPPLQLAIGDVVELQGFQNCGSALSTYNGTDCTSCFGAYWISS